MYSCVSSSEETCRLRSNAESSGTVMNARSSSEAGRVTASGSHETGTRAGNVGTASPDMRGSKTTDGGTALGRSQALMAS